MIPRLAQKYPTEADLAGSYAMPVALGRVSHSSTMLPPQAVLPVGGHWPQPVVLDPVSYAIERRGTAG